jgi:hypothetical protein
MGPNLYGSVLAEARFFEASAQLNSASLYSLGASINFPASRTFAFPVTAKYKWGQFENSSSLTGYEIGVGLTVQF